MPLTPKQAVINPAADPGLQNITNRDRQQITASGGVTVFKAAGETFYVNTLENVTKVVTSIVQAPAGGANNQIQFNEGGQLVGDTGLTYDPESDVLSVTGVATSNLIVSTSADLGDLANITISGGSDGQLLKTDGEGNLIWASASAAVTGDFTFDGSNMSTSGDTIININAADSRSVSINSGRSTGFSQLYWVPDLTDTANVDPIEGGLSYNWAYIDEDGFTVTTATDGNHDWHFGTDGNLSMPDITQLNSGGIGEKNSAVFGTEVILDGPGGNITSSQVYMGAGTGETRIMVDGTTGNSLAYFGVEDTTLPGFAGVVASDPNVTSMYQVGTDDGDNIILGATQPGGELTSTDYKAAIGVLNANLTINGLYADQTGVIMSGGGANNSSTIWAVENGIGITNTLYPSNDSSIDIGTPEKTFDSLYVNSIKATQNLTIDAGSTFSYWMNSYGDITLANSVSTGSSVAYDSNGNIYVIGQITDPDTLDTDTLALKYSPDGNLLWRKVWVDDNGDACGSYNQEFCIDNGTIYWMSTTNTPGKIYIGKMDTDGVITSAATMIEGNALVCYDMAVEAGTNYVYAVGQQSDGINDSPIVLKVDTSTNEVLWTIWLGDYAGIFNSVTVTNDNVFIGGQMVDSINYCTLTKIGTDGTYVGTTKLNDIACDSVNTCVASNGYGNIVVAYTLTGSAGTVITKFSYDDILTPIWTRLIAASTDYYVINATFDSNDQCYIVGTTNSGTNGNICKLDNEGNAIWQRVFYDTSNRSVLISYSNGSKILAMYSNDRFAVTTGTLTNPLDGGSVPPHSLTLQLPADGSLLGLYGYYWWNEDNLTFDITYTAVLTDWAMPTQNTTLPTYSDNSGFIPSSILKNPAYFPVRTEMSGSLDVSWAFDNEGTFTLPGESYISTNAYYGHINIQAGNKRGNDLTNTNSGQINLSDGSGNTEINLDQTGFEISHNSTAWIFRGNEVNSINTSVIEDRYSNVNDISKRYARATEKELPMNATMSTVVISGYVLTFDTSVGVNIEPGLILTSIDGDSIVAGTTIVSGSGTEWRVSVSQSATCATVAASKTINPIWIAQYMSMTSGKFTAHIETVPNNNDNNFDTMTSEMTLAVKRVSDVYTSPKLSVYGIVHTSDEPLGTFDAIIIPGGVYYINFDSDLSLGSKGTGTGGIARITNYLGYYQISIENGGIGYVKGDLIYIPGNLLGGYQYDNQMTLQAYSVDSETGEIQGLSVPYPAITYAGRVAITYTPAISPAYDSFVKIFGKESSSPTIDYYC